MPSIKKNVIYSSILTTANYVFPLLTYPYVSRVLGVDNIGVVNFVDSVVYYFVLISMLGISVCGIREIAACRGDRERMSMAFSSLLSLNFLTTIVALVAMIGAIVWVPQLQENAAMMHIGIIKLCFSFLCIEWFYQGIEDFRYITRRTILVKCCYVVAVFLFVRESSDYRIFYLLMVLMVAVNAVINLVHARKFVNFSLKGLRFRPFLPAFLIMGAYLLLTSMYTSFNVTYLGFVSDDTQVGYYATATKLYGILLALFTAFTGVLMPRMSALLADGRIQEFKEFFFKSSGVLMAFAIPAVLAGMILAPEVVYLLSGPGYEGAITPMRIVLPLVFIIGYEQILVIQTLMPLKSDRIVFRNSLIAGVVAVALNLLIVPHLFAAGSALVWLICELLVLTLSQIAVTRLTGIKPPCGSFITQLLAYLPMCALLVGMESIVDGAFMRLLAAGVIIVLYVAAVNLLFFPESIVSQTIARLRRSKTK